MDTPASHFIHDIIDADLAAGRETKVHTRFPPEPNGYIHIGNAKAIWISWNAARTYEGLFNLRYDDTNPVREDDEYVTAIEEDLRWLGTVPTGGIFYGSDYFPQCYAYAESLIEKGLAYVCDLSQEEVSRHRGTLTEPGQNSPYRERTAAENLDLFRRMKAGEFANGTRTLRAKIDMSAPNMNMRDPVLYRILHVPHHRQGSAWCVYPMYDYAHPIQDALEGITHSLCSLEFENHRPLYDWVVNNLDLPFRPHQYEFARLNITYTIMSKRHLRALVETGAVDGWDDPRMPTLRGLRRRGVPPAAILEFLARSGVAKANSLSDIRLLEYCVCEELNRTALRRVAILDPLPVTIVNYPEDKTEHFSFPNNPNQPESGARSLPFARDIFVERSDFLETPPKGFHRLTPGGEVRLMGAYLVRCESVEKDSEGRVTRLYCRADLETGSNMPADGRKVRGTVHWLSAIHAVKAEVRLYDNLFTAENVSAAMRDDNLGELLNPDSLRIVSDCLVEPSLAGAAPGEQYQFVRTGYFCADSRHPGVFNRTAPLKSGYKPG